MTPAPTESPRYRWWVLGVTSVGAFHIAFAAGVVASAAGAVVSLMRGEHQTWESSRGDRRVAA